MKPGDKVQWTETSSKGRSFSAHLRQGVFVGVEGGAAVVKLSSGKTHLVPAARLQLAGERSDVTNIVEALRGIVR